MAPVIARFQVQYQQYEHMQDISHFYVELTLDCPYWSDVRSTEYNKTPDFSDTCQESPAVGHLRTNTQNTSLVVSEIIERLELAVKNSQSVEQVKKLTDDIFNGIS